MATSSSISTEKEGAAASGSPPAQSVLSEPKEPGDDLPRLLGRYLLLRRIARGGMGEVFLGSTTGLEGAERPVVVKIIRREHVKDPSFIARFLDEARVQAQLHHSGVAQVLEAATCEASGEPYAVIEHVEGKSLGDVRARALQIGYRVGWVEAVAVATMIAEALAHVHERQDPSGRALAIVHRDLSPQNVMLSFSGDVKIIDFGTARGLNRRCRTVAGVVFAKPGYVAPEVANGESGDARVDVYALGVMLWELCAGRRFLQGDAGSHMAGVARDQIHPPPIADSCGAPAELDAIIARLTSFERDARYSESRVAACDLAKLLGSAGALPTGERGVRPRAARLMQSLFPSEPSRSRREFAKLVAAAQAQAKAAAAAAKTPAMDPSKVLARLTGSTIGSDFAPSKGAAGASDPARAGEAVQPGELGDMGEPGVLAGTRYRLIRELGRGASSIVFEAEHMDLGRRVALKVLAAEHTGVKEFAARFRREARALSLLSHDGLVKIIDFGLASDGRLFCVMELLAGETLEERLTRENRIEWREALGIAVSTLRALQVAHAAHIVHRDIKPANLFLTRSGGVKLLDFGLAKAIPEVMAPALQSVLDGSGKEAASAQASATAESSRSINEPGEELTRRAGLTILGTPEYMAPEQASAGQGDARSDVYAVGCVIYEMLTGSLPFTGSGAVAVLAAKIKGSPERPCERSPSLGLPRMVDDLVMRALARHPSVRFQTAAEMRKAVEAAIEAPLVKRAGRRVIGLSTFAAVMAFAAVLLVGRAKEIKHVVVGWVGSGQPAAAELVAQEQPIPAPPVVEGSADLGALTAGLKPIEADPVRIGPEPAPSSGDAEGADDANTAPPEEEDFVAEGGDADSDEGVADPVIVPANKAVAHQVLPLLPKPSRPRHRSHRSSSEEKKATASSKASDGASASKVASAKDDSKPAAKKDAKAPEGATAAASTPAPAQKTAERSSSPVKGERSASHDAEPGDPPAAAPKATDGDRAQPKVTPSTSTKTARKDHGPRRKKKSRVAKKGE